MNESLEDLVIVNCKDELDNNLDNETNELSSIISNNCENVTKGIEYIHNEICAWKFSSGFLAVISEPFGESPGAVNWTDAHH